MGAGLWFDLILGLLLATLLALIVRLRSNSVAPAFPPEISSVASGARLRAVAYFNRVARQAGFDPVVFSRTFWPAKIALAALLPVLALELGSRWASVGVLVFLVIMGFFIPDAWLFLARQRRRRRVRAALSFFLDLLVSLLHSGLALPEAFRRTGTEGLDRTHPLAREATLVGLELEAGKEWGAAFQALAERTGVREMQSVAGALGLGLQLGTPLATSLRAQADLLRTQRREKARRRIHMAQLKSLFPLLLCGFPIFLVLVIFPALVEIFDVLQEIAALF